MITRRSITGMMMFLALAPACSSKGPSPDDAGDMVVPRTDSKVDDAVPDHRATPPDLIPFDAFAGDFVELDELGSADLCVPDCDGKQCGPDGCGGSCGGCSDWEACLAYFEDAPAVCVDAVELACEEVECGNAWFGQCIDEECMDVWPFCPCPDGQLCIGANGNLVEEYPGGEEGSCTSAVGFCGNGKCNSEPALAEDCSTCPADCGCDSQSWCDNGDCVPHAWCEEGGVKGHLKHLSAYWVASNAYGDHWSEVTGALTAAHADPNSLAGVPEGTQVIVDVVWHLFKPAQGIVNPNIDTTLDNLENLVAGYEDRIAAFYVFDEPYLDSHKASRTVLEQGIAKLKERFPAIPAYVTFAHHCFDPAASDPACDELPAGDKGIPANLDWVSFDWYSDGSCGSALDKQFKCHVTDGVDRLEKLHDGAIMLTGEALSSHLGQPGLIEMAHRSFGLALKRSQVIGIDFFIWADVPAAFQGITSMPELRRVVRGLARVVRTACGSNPDVVPIFEWYESTCPDHRYEAGYWEGWEATAYRPQKLAFGLLPESAGAVPLYSCPIDRGNGCVDHYLSKDEDCNDVDLAQPATVIGYLGSADTEGLVPLHRFTQTVWPWDHVYTTDPEWPGVPGKTYAHDFSIGHVVAPEDI